MKKLKEAKCYPWLLVVSYSLLGIFFPAAVTQFSMVVNDVANALQVNRQVVLLADSTRAICLVAAMFLSGYVYKCLGLKKTMGLGLMFQILPQFVVPIAVQFQCVPMLFVLKGMQGLNAMAFPLYISTISVWMDRNYVALATAIFNGSFMAGSGIGAWIAGKIVPALGWQASFYAIGGICLIFAIPALLITEDKERPEEVKPAKSIDTKKSKKPNVYGTIVRQPLTWILCASLIANTWVCQSVTVDMSVYANSIGYNYGQTGNLMLMISVVTVVSSMVAGGVSDWFAARARKKTKSRCWVMGLGYAISMAGGLMLPIASKIGFWGLAAAACLMMFGANWGMGGFYALPVELYSAEDNVAATAFCSGASNIPNPIAPMVVGVLLGTNGHWTAAWMTCAAVSAVSFAASLAIPKVSENRKGI